MAPHRALTIPDVLHQVFKHFETHSWLTTADAEFAASELPSSLRNNNEACYNMKAHAKVKRRTLAHAARTCKAFAEPASHILWKAVDGLGPLLSVLKNAQTSGGGDNALDWARFEHVARRVRALLTATIMSYDANTGRPMCYDANTGRPMGYDADALALVRSRYDGGPILPNLRAFFYGSPPLDAAILGALCASPALISIKITESIPTVSENLIVMSNTCPEIIHLDAVYDIDLNADGYRALPKFKNLHTARFSSIDDALFRHLGTLPRLRELHGYFDISSNPKMGTKAAFPALQGLSVWDTTDDSNFLAALPFISSRSLAVLSLNTEVERTEDLVEYLETLCTAPALAHLRELKFEISLSFSQWEYPDEEFFGVDFTADVLPSLRCLPPTLEVLAMDVVFTTSTVASFTVTDADLESIAERWPDLTKLSISHYIEDDEGGSEGGGISRPSLDALISLVERCRKLETVYVEFNGVDVGELKALEARAGACVAPQTALRRIVDGPWCTDFREVLYLTDTERVAAALRKLFPNVGSSLEALEAEGKEGEDEEEHVGNRWWALEFIEMDLLSLMKALGRLSARRIVL